MFGYPVKLTTALLLLFYTVMIAGMAGCLPEEGSTHIPGKHIVYAEPAEHVDPCLVEANTGFALDLFHALYKGKPHEGHKANFFRCIREGGLPVSDVFTHVQAMGTCHLSAIAARLGRVLKWDPKAEKFIDDDQANKFVARERGARFEILKVT